jgi:hypothetical protein
MARLRDPSSLKLRRNDVFGQPVLSPGEGKRTLSLSLEDGHDFHIRRLCEHIEGLDFENSPAVIN